MRKGERKGGREGGREGEREGEKKEGGRGKEGEDGFMSKTRSSYLSFWLTSLVGSLDDFSISGGIIGLDVRVNRLLYKAGIQLSLG